MIDIVFGRQCLPILSEWYRQSYPFRYDYTGRLCISIKLSTMYTRLSPRQSVKTWLNPQWGTWSWQSGYTDEWVFGITRNDRLIKRWLNKRAALVSYLFGESDHRPVVVGHVECWNGWNARSGRFGRRILQSMIHKQIHDRVNTFQWFPFSLFRKCFRVSCRFEQKNVAFSRFAIT